MSRVKLGLAVSVVVALAATASASTVKTTPAHGTPQLHLIPGRIQNVRQLVQCGQTEYAVGDFMQIQSHGQTFRRLNAFSFHATKPYRLTGWNPQVNGEVNSVAFVHGHCQTAYLGGSFTKVHGTPATNIAAVSTKTGTVVRRFSHNANAPVETLAAVRGTLLVGGYFTKINGSAGHLFAGLNSTTGHNNGFAQLGPSGFYHYCDFRGCAHDPPRVYNQQLSHSGRFDLIEGVFTSVGHKPRQQIAMLNVAGKHATVTGWTSPEFDRHCASVESFYVRAAAWSPNDQSIYVGDTGYRYDMPNGARGGPPMRYLCDAAAAFPASLKSVMPRWINWTGCDSLYSVAASSSIVYFGGHERWSTNRYACDSPGRGHINAPGMEGLSAKTGRLVFNPGRARGIGADDMTVNRSGLWIASDDMAGGLCGGELNHAGICRFTVGR